MRRELRPVNVQASEYPPVEHPFLQCILDKISDGLEMLAYLIGNAALGVTSVISLEAIAAATMRKRVKEIHALGQLAETELEQAGAMTIQQHDAEAGKRSQELRQGFEVEMPINHQLRAAEVGGQVVLAPKTLRGTGKHGLGVRTIAAQLL